MESEDFEPLSTKVQECLRLGRIPFKQFTKLNTFQANINSIFDGDVLEASFTLETLDTIPSIEEIFNSNY